MPGHDLDVAARTAHYADSALADPDGHRQPLLDLSLSHHDVIARVDEEMRRRADRPTSEPASALVADEVIDLIIRPLYAATINLSAMLADPSLHQHAPRLTEAIDDVDAAICRIRAYLSDTMALRDPQSQSSRHEQQGNW
jgi:hypothetical protein